MSAAKVKGIFIISDGIPVPFQFNPLQLTEKRSVNYAAQQGISQSHPKYDYQNGEGRPMSWTMHLSRNMKIGDAVIPYPADLYIAQLEDLTYPIFQGGMMIDGPPTILFIFGAVIRFLKIQSIETVRKEFNEYLITKSGTIKITTIEIVSTSKERFNSIKNIGL